MAPRSTDFRGESPDAGDEGAASGASAPDSCDREDAPDGEDPRVDGGAPFVEDSPAVDEERAPEEPESGAAEQMAGVVVTAEPTPRATASVPILPMCLT
ncbi:MAG: hypothetical protein WAL26_19845 [Mycobacterium sp.]